MEPACCTLDMMYVSVVFGVLLVVKGSKCARF